VSKQEFLDFVEPVTVIIVVLFFLAMVTPSCSCRMSIANQPIEKEVKSGE